MKEHPSAMKEFQNHPLADVFPMMGDVELKELADDIKKNGLRDLICLYEDKILDGRNRYAACKMIGIDPTVRCYSMTKEDFEERHITPLKYITSLNLHRRHLSLSQRTVIAVKLADIEHGQVGGGHDRQIGKSTALVSQAEAATLLNVSESMVHKARKIIKHAPEKVLEIERGEKTINKAMTEIREKNADEYHTATRRSKPEGNLPLSFKAAIGAVQTEIENMIEKKWHAMNKEEAKNEIKNLLTLF